MLQWTLPRMEQQQQAQELSSPPSAKHQQWTTVNPRTHEWTKFNQNQYSDLETIWKHCRLETTTTECMVNALHLPLAISKVWTMTIQLLKMEMASQIKHLKFPFNHECTQQHKYELCIWVLHYFPANNIMNWLNKHKPFSMNQDGYPCNSSQTGTKCQWS